MGNLPGKDGERRSITPPPIDIGGATPLWASPHGEREGRLPGRVASVASFPG